MYSTVTIIQFQNELLEKEYLPMIDSTYAGLLKLLDNIPPRVDIKFTEGANDETGVGGFAVSAKQINLAVWPDFHEKELQRNNLRAVMMHETFHIQQGFTFDKQPFTALEAAIYEGCAVVFEKQHGKGRATYADYSDNSEDELEKWLAEIRTVGTRYFEDRETWQSWAYYHPEYDEKWIIYKVGSFMIDRLLKERRLDILDLKNKTASEIMAMIDEPSLLR